MNLGRRFFMLNTLTVLITILVTALGIVIFIAVYTRIFRQDAGVSDLTRAIEVRAGFEEIKKSLAYDSQGNLGANSKDELTASVKALGADALVLRNREVIFSTKKFRKMDIEKCLALSGDNSSNETIELDGKIFIFDRLDFYVKNGESAVLILLAPIRIRTGFYQSLVLFTALLFIVSFLGMNLWVSLDLTKGVITPVSRLREAASRISEGDLSCVIVEEGDSEVRELCRTLEQMRIKLKESVYLQGKYDENRKFLISSISHDLKTPVTSIKGYIEGIIDGVANTPEKMSAYLEIVRSKAILVNSMIDDLLLYSKLDLNQIPFNFEKTDLEKYFEDCVSDYKHEFEKANINIELRSELTEAVFVIIDRERLKRVVQNILDNAKKYIIRTDGHVAVILRQTRTSAIIEVKDNGKGIPEEDLPHIFDRFYRADASRKSTEGSGLGLAIARQIVEGHDGRIWAVSSESKGTSIIMSLKKC